jgi:signal transduction histidine kinase
VQDAIDEVGRLAQTIHVPLLDVGLAAALRSAAVSAGIRASVEVAAGSSYAPEVLTTVHRCWLDALADAGGSPPELTVREEDGSLVFELVRAAPFDDRTEGLRDRVEALGGTLTTRPEPGGRVRVSGSLPVAR